MQEYNSEICKNHCQIVGQKKKKKKWNDMVDDVVQLEHSSIKRYASTFSNIQIYILKIKVTFGNGSVGE